MRRWFPALLAVLVVAATASGSPALALPSDSSPVVQTENESVVPADRQQSAPVVGVPNTSSYLALPASDVRTDQFGTARLDVAGAVDAESAQLHDEFLVTRVFQSFRNADDDRERTAILRTGADEIEARNEALQDLQDRTIREYNRGSISTTLFLRRLAVIDTRARQLNRVVDRVIRELGSSPTYSLPNSLRTRYQNLRAQPSIIQGPNRERIGTAITGAQSSATVYIETSTDGIALARASGNSYTREAYVGAEFGGPGDDQFTRDDQAPISAAYDQARELYPWTIDNDITVPSASGFGNTSVYRITVDHTQGTLVSFLEGRTTNVFRETQDKRLSAIPTVTNATNATEQLRIVANRTHPSGPMEISVTRFNSTETLDARITVDDHFVGRTGDDGRLWAVEPAGSVTVTAVTDEGERVTLQLSPVIMSERS